MPPAAGRAPADRPPAGRSLWPAGWRFGTAVSTQGVVVFRAPSRGGMGGEAGGMGGGEPERGICMRKLAEQGPLFMVFRRGGTVPLPNNTTIGEDDQLASPLP